MVLPKNGIRACNRLNKRYKVLDGVFVVLEPSSNSSRLGGMLDISKGGLSFQFIDTKGPGGSYSELDIFVSGFGIQVESLPFEIISNVLMEEPTPPNPVITRRLGVKFTSLSKAKKAQIYSFIQNHAIYDVLPDSLA